MKLYKIVNHGEMQTQTTHNNSDMKQKNKKQVGK